MLCNVASSELGQPYTDWVAGDQFKFLRLIAKAENRRGEPERVNYLGCKGIWQINQRAHRIKVPDCPLWQTRWALRYIKSRHGTPERAWSYHRRRNSY